ncbi:MAG: hypothetical protein ACQEU4_07680 [Bacillota bacterium]
MNRLNKFIEKNSIRFLVMLLIVLFIISFWSSYFLVFVKSPIGLGVISKDLSSDWLQWMGAFIGGAIGGIFAFVGIKITLENQRKEIQFENKRKALPLIDIKVGEYDYKNKYIQFDFCFTKESHERERKNIPDTANVTIALENVGLREMYDLYVGDIKSAYFKTKGEYFRIAPIVYNGKSIPLNLAFYEKGTYDNDKYEGIFNTYKSSIAFKCYFKDCYDNWYHQEFSISLFHAIEQGVSEEKSALNISYGSYEIMSKPIEISRENLPWENGKSVIHT